MTTKTITVRDVSSLHTALKRVVAETLFPDRIYRTFKRYIVKNICVGPTGRMIHNIIVYSRSRFMYLSTIKYLSPMTFDRKTVYCDS